MNLASCKRPVSACDDAQGSVANEFSLVLKNGAIDKNGFVYELACALQRGELTDGQSSNLIAYKINLSHCWLEISRCNNAAQADIPSTYPYWA